MRIALALALALAATALLAQEVKTVSDFEDGRVRYRTVIGGIAPADFAKMAADTLGPEGVTLGVLTAYGSPETYAAAGAPGGPQCNFESWRSRVTAWDRTKLGCPEVQQAVKIGPNMVVRTIGRDCRRAVDGSSGALGLFLGGANFEILHVAVGGGSARFYVRTDRPPSGKLARSALQSLAVATGVRNLSVTLRSDKWFCDDCGFPAYYPFEDLEIPSRQAFLRTKAATCTMDGGGSIQCAESAAQ